MPLSSDEVLWKLSARVGAAFRIAKGDGFLLGQEDEGVVHIMATLAKSLQLLGDRLLPIGNQPAMKALLQSRAEVRELVNLLSMLAIRAHPVPEESVEVFTMSKDKGKGKGKHKTRRNEEVKSDSNCKEEVVNIKMYEELAVAEPRSPKESEELAVAEPSSYECCCSSC